MSFVPTISKVRKNKEKNLSLNNLPWNNCNQENKKNIYKEKFKTLKKEFEERLNDLSGIWIGRITLVKITLLPKAIYKLNVIAIRILTLFSIKIQENLKIHIEVQKTPGSQSNSR